MPDLPPPRPWLGFAYIVGGLIIARIAAGGHPPPNDDYRALWHALPMAQRLVVVLGFIMTARGTGKVIDAFVARRRYPNQ